MHRGGGNSKQGPKGGGVVNKILTNACDKQGYFNLVLDIFPVNNFVHRMFNIRIGKLKFIR